MGPYSFISSSTWRRHAEHLGTIPGMCAIWHQIKRCKTIKGVQAPRDMSSSHTAAAIDSQGDQAGSSLRMQPGQKTWSKDHLLSCGHHKSKAALISPWPWQPFLAYEKQAVKCWIWARCWAHDHEELAHILQILGILHAYTRPVYMCLGIESGALGVLLVYAYSFGHDHDIKFNSSV